MLAYEMSFSQMYAHVRPFHYLSRDSSPLVDQKMKLPVWPSCKNLVTGNVARIYPCNLNNNTASQSCTVVVRTAGCVHSKYTLTHNITHYCVWSQQPRESVSPVLWRVVNGVRVCAIWPKLKPNHRTHFRSHLSVSLRYYIITQ